MSTKSLEDIQYAILQYYLLFLEFKITYTLMLYVIQLLRYNDNY